MKRGVLAAADKGLMAATSETAPPPMFCLLFSVCVFLRRRLGVPASAPERVPLRLRLRDTGRSSRGQMSTTNQRYDSCGSRRFFVDRPQTDVTNDASALCGRLRLTAISVSEPFASERLPGCKFHPGLRDRVHRVSSTFQNTTRCFFLARSQCAL